jgi:hypothetical protein
MRLILGSKSSFVFKMSVFYIDCTDILMYCCSTTVDECFAEFLQQICPGNAGFMPHMQTLRGVSRSVVHAGDRVVVMVVLL